jgi:predicted O-methyltransferase YrrM
MNYFYDKIKNINYFKYGMMSPLNLEILYLVIRTTKPNIVVETGICSGSSSLFILAALDRGKLYSIDLPPHVSEERFYPKNLKIGWLVPTNLKKKWSIILGDSKVVLPELLAKLGSIDVFLHDSLHTYEHMMFEFKTAWKYLKQPKIIISDDVNANNAFYDFAKFTKSRYIIIGKRTGILFKK